MESEILKEKKPKKTKKEEQQSKNRPTKNPIKNKTIFV